MISVMVFMLLALALAGLVLVYVAFPHRGEEVPHAPQVGRMMNRAVGSLPTLHQTGPVSSEQKRAGSTSGDERRWWG